MQNLSRGGKAFKCGVVLSFILSFFLFLPSPSVRAGTDYLLIVEIQIAGDSSSNDFIKIYNPASQDFDISGYKLKKKASTGSESSIRVFPQGSSIKSGGYFLWANSKENFHLKVGADVWSTATLAKNNSIALFNSEGIILDAVGWGESQSPFFESSVFPENPGSNQKLERKKTEGIYQDTNNNARDFFLNPPSQISVSQTESTESLNKKDEELKTEVEENQSEQKQLSYPSGIIINEILPSPTGPDAEDEWIEILNQNKFEVDLSNWRVEDAAGKITGYIFSEGTKIPAGGFLVLSRPTTKITLNNDGDGLKIIKPNEETTDEVNYEKAPTGKSYNRVDSGWVWSDALTPGSANIISPLGNNGQAGGNNEAEESLIEEETQKPETKKEEIKKGLAAAGEQVSDKNPSTFFILLIAIFISVFFGIIILILKRKLKSG